MNYLLFTTTTCPKCPAMKEFVSQNLANFSGEVLDNTTSGFMDKAQKFGITSVPVLIIFEDGKEVFLGSEIYEIEDFLLKFSP